MQANPDLMGYIFRQYRRQRLLIGFPDGPDGAECLSQLRLPLRPQTGDAVQYRAYGAFGVMLVVIGDGKAVEEWLLPLVMQWLST